MNDITLGTEAETTTTARRRNRTPANANTVNTEDADLGVQDRSITLESDMSLAELRDALNSSVSPDVGTPDFKDFAANLEFMEEEVLVRVFPSSDKNAEMVIDVYNNGTPQRFIRGKWQICKRKYVEVLARAKPFGVSTPEIIDGNGNRTTAINTNTGLRYPFEMKDQNPRGQGWLQSILQES